MKRTYSKIMLEAARFEDYDNPLTAAELEYLEAHPNLSKWEVEAEYKDDMREYIILNVPSDSD